MRCHEIIIERGKRAWRFIYSEQRRGRPRRLRSSGGQRRLGGSKKRRTSWPSRTAVALRQSERMARGAARWSVLLGSLALALALIAPFTAALSKRDLYQYVGPGSNVLENDSNRMLISAEAPLKTPIVFFDKIYNSIFVSTDKEFGLEYWTLVNVKLVKTIIQTAEYIFY